MVVTGLFAAMGEAVAQVAQETGVTPERSDRMGSLALLILLSLTNVQDLEQLRAPTLMLQGALFSFTCRRLQFRTSTVDSLGR